MHPKEVHKKVLQEVTTMSLMQSLKNQNNSKDYLRDDNKTDFICPSFIEGRVGSYSPA